jgi:type IV secretory pathway TraG/TraD family ATPase VirD4
VGAQTKGQFHRLSGRDGTQALFTGLATQIVYGDCDVDTADFYSGASGTTTVDANPDPTKANLRRKCQISERGLDQGGLIGYAFTLNSQES